MNFALTRYGKDRARLKASCRKAILASGEGADKLADAVDAAVDAAPTDEGCLKVTVAGSSHNTGVGFEIKVSHGEPPVMADDEEGLEMPKAEESPAEESPAEEVPAS